MFPLLKVETEWKQKWKHVNALVEPVYRLSFHFSTFLTMYIVFKKNVTNVTKPITFSHFHVFLKKHYISQEKVESGKMPTNPLVEPLKCFHFFRGKSGNIFLRLSRFFLEGQKKAPKRDKSEKNVTKIEKV